MDAEADADADGGTPSNPKLPFVFQDFKGRRAAIIKALTTDFKEFYQKCDPAKEELCLYGYPNELWEVRRPTEMVPTELPEPVIGINFARDDMEGNEWLSFVAGRCDTWLITMAMHYCGRLEFDKGDRWRLFTMMNDLPTVLEVVSGEDKKKGMKKSSVFDHDNKRRKSNSEFQRGSTSQGNTSQVGNIYQGNTSQGKYPKAMESKDWDGLEEDNEELCGACGENYGVDEFWICCDICDRWYHGKCVNITPAKAEYIKKFRCPSCSNKKHLNYSF